MRRLQLALSMCLVLFLAPLAGPAEQNAAAPANAPASPDQGQAAAQPGQSQAGPLVLEPIHSGWVIAPDLRITRINSTTQTLLGAYGGWLAENGLLLGAGGYFDLGDNHNDVGMSYGGFVIGWSVPVGSAIRFGARGLVGGGQATIPTTITVTVPQFPHHGFPFDNDNTIPTTFTRNVRFHQGFFIAEPQADVIIRLASWARFNAGVGYRLIGDANGYDSQLRGVVGTVAVRFGAGS